MEWAPFHHPDYCVPVLARRLGLDLLQALDGWMQFLFTWGRSAYWHHPDYEKRSCSAAARRLAKEGLIVRRRSDGRLPVMELTDEGRRRLPEEFHPEGLWDRRWNGIWNLLVYDIPEEERHYRARLRRFLVRMRMGKLQGSVWISPRDMRPVYADMAEACGLEQHGVLFESRTVLGMEPRVIVDTAWNFDRIGASQQWFCRTAEDNLKRAAESPAPPEVLQALLREECAAYLAVMERDPLLPRELWPRDYRGVEALQTHRRFHQDMARLLADAAR